jgi:hypothetical protein
MIFALTSLAAMAFGFGLIYAPEPGIGAAVLKQGPEKCKKCHKAEHAVWEGSAHGKSFRDIHKRDKADDIAAKVGGGKMRKNALCQQCHFTVIDKRGRARANAGPSCESCHGNATDWIEVHNNEKRPLAARRQETETMGMIWPDMKYDIAENCFECHGLSKLAGSEIDALLNAGHPINGDYEVVRYSQGSVRHRFYPPDVKTNAKMTRAELANFYAIGQLVSLVDATNALSKSSHPAYQAALGKRIDRAKEVIGSIPNAGGVLGSPSEAVAREMVGRLGSSDISGAIGSFLPSESDYK